MSYFHNIIISFCIISHKKIAQAGDLSEIRTFLKNVGSNFVLKDKKFEWLAKRGYRIVGEIAGNSTVLRALHAFRTAIWQIPGNISPFKIVNYW